MKKEYLFIFAISLIIFAQVVDSISGPINIGLKNPYSFLQNSIISRIPLTAVGVFARSLGVFTTVVLTLSFIDKMFFAKAISVFFVSVVSNLFAIQQIATNTRTITLQWTLSLAYAGLVLLLPALIYTIRGFLSPIIKKPTTYEENQEIST